MERVVEVVLCDIKQSDGFNDSKDYDNNRVMANEHDGLNVPVLDTNSHSENTVNTSQQSPTTVHSKSLSSSFTAKSAVVESGPPQLVSSCTHQDPSDYYQWEAIRVGDRKFARSLASELEAPELFDLLVPQPAAFGADNNTATKVSPRTVEPRSTSTLSRALISKNWQIQNSGVYALQLAAKANPAGLSPFLSALSHPVCQCCQSLRSSVSKNAMLCVAHIARGCGTAVPKDFIQILLPALICKAAHDKKFVAETAFKAAAALCDAHFGCLHEVQFIQLSKLTKDKSNNAVMMAKVAEVLSAALSSLYSFLVSRNAVPKGAALSSNYHCYGENLVSPESIKNHLLPMLAYLLVDRLPQTKKAARAALSTLNALWSIRSTNNDLTAVAPGGVFSSGHAAPMMFTEFIHTCLLTGGGLDSIQRAALFKGLSDVGNISPPPPLHSGTTVPGAMDGNPQGLQVSLGHGNLSSSGAMDTDSGDGDRPRRRRAASSTAVGRATARRSQSLSTVVSSRSSAKQQQQIQRLVKPLLPPTGENLSRDTGDKSVDSLSSTFPGSLTGHEGVGDTNYHPTTAGSTVEQNITSIDGDIDAHDHRHYSFSRRPLRSNLAVHTSESAACVSSMMPPPMMIVPHTESDHGPNSLAPVVTEATTSKATDGESTTSIAPTAQLYKSTTESLVPKEQPQRECSSSCRGGGVPLDHLVDAGEPIAGPTTTATGVAVVGCGGNAVAKPWPQFKSRSSNHVQNEDTASLIMNNVVATDPANYVLHSIHDSSGSADVPESLLLSTYNISSVDVLHNGVHIVETKNGAVGEVTVTGAAGGCDVASLLIGDSITVNSMSSSVTQQKPVMLPLPPTVSQLQFGNRLRDGRQDNVAAAQRMTAGAGEPTAELNLRFIGRGGVDFVDKSCAVQKITSSGNSPAVHDRDRDSPATAKRSTTVPRNGLCGVGSPQSSNGNSSNSRQPRMRRWNSSTSIGKIDSKYYHGSGTTPSVSGSGSIGGSSRAPSIKRMQQQDHRYSGGDCSSNNSINKKGRVNSLCNKSSCLPPVYSQQSSSIIPSTVVPRRSASLSKRSVLSVQQQQEQRRGLQMNNSTSLSSTIGANTIPKSNCSNINKLQTANRKHQASMLLGLGHQRAAARLPSSSRIMGLVTIAGTSPSALSTASAPSAGHVMRGTKDLFGIDNKRGGATTTGSPSYKRRNSNDTIRGAAGVNHNSAGKIASTRHFTNLSPAATETTPDLAVLGVSAGGIIGGGNSTVLTSGKASAQHNSTRGSAAGHQVRNRRDKINSVPLGDKEQRQIAGGTTFSNTSNNIRNYYLKDNRDGGCNHNPDRQHGLLFNGTEHRNGSNNGGGRRLLPRIPPHPLNVAGAGAASINSHNSSSMRRGNSCVATASNRSSRVGSEAVVDPATSGRRRSGSKPVWRIV
eukprot:Lankesteria_metandrocarpae@DN5033_c1_g1_i1.p1